MTGNDFQFALPPAQIAQSACEPRDHARLLVVHRASRSLQDAHVYDLPSLLPARTHIVVNNSRVRRARLFGMRSNGQPCEVLVLHVAIDGAAQCLLRGRRYLPGETLTIAGRTVKVIGPGDEDGTYALALGTDAEAWLEEVGSMPLPPYLAQDATTPERYQTVYAADAGSAAAPTAGLHFTPELIASLQENHPWSTVTLHVGTGTFKPLPPGELRGHQLHREETFLSPEVVAAVRETKAKGSPLLAVGTTSVRTLEARWQNGFTPGWEAVNLFLTPGSRFSVATCMLTNFHMPQTSLCALVAAFLGCGEDGSPALSPGEAVAFWRETYEHAVHSGYRFASLGDAMLIL